MTSWQQPSLPRSAGILLPIFSLPSPWGIGTLGTEAYRWIDFLADAGQHWWQILPLNPVGLGDSPYCSPSAFAGNPYFIDPQTLYQQGLLTRSELLSLRSEGEWVEYSRLSAQRLPILRRAFRRSTFREQPAYRDFCKENDFWFTDTCTFMAWKSRDSGKSWRQWEEGVCQRIPGIWNELPTELQEEADFHRFLQYEFFRQWMALKDYAHQKGVAILGDVPIYVAEDSCDVWAHREIFQLDHDGAPIDVAGVPPDHFSATGQRWGNPLYRWDILQERGFGWWRERFFQASRLFDGVRVDHFLGMVRYYAIPARHPTAEQGKWREAAGREMLDSLSDLWQKFPLVAENLGAVTAEVSDYLQAHHIPGMRLMSFGFDSDGHDPNLPSQFERNCVVYTGTHDNDTIQGQFLAAPEEWRARVREYFGLSADVSFAKAFLRAAYASVADTVLLPMQDILGLDHRARINRPSTVGGNWRWRLSEGDLTPALAKELARMVTLYGRDYPRE